MFSTAGNKSSLERRLKDLEKEARLVQGDIKSLSRALRKPEEISAIPRLKSIHPEYVKPPSRRDPILAEPPRETSEPEEEEAGEPQGGGRPFLVGSPKYGPPGSPGFRTTDRHSGPPAPAGGVRRQTIRQLFHERDLYHSAPPEDREERAKEQGHRHDHSSGPCRPLGFQPLVLALR